MAACSSPTAAHAADDLGATVHGWCRAECCFQRLRFLKGRGQPCRDLRIGWSKSARSRCNPLLKPAWRGWSRACDHPLLPFPHAAQLVPSLKPADTVAPPALDRLREH
eukprot:194377-Chlamydomonas_euryale.AAC.2